MLRKRILPLEEEITALKLTFKLNPLALVSTRKDPRTKCLPFMVEKLLHHISRKVSIDLLNVLNMLMIITGHSIAKKDHLVAEIKTHLDVGKREELMEVITAHHNEDKGGE